MASCCKCSHQLEWCEGEKYYYCLNPFCIAEGRPQIVVPEPAPAAPVSGESWSEEVSPAVFESTQRIIKDALALRAENASLRAELAEIKGIAESLHWFAEFVKGSDFWDGWLQYGGDSSTVESALAAYAALAGKEKQDA